MDLEKCEELISSMEINIKDLQRISFMSNNMYEKIFYSQIRQIEIYKVNTLKNFINNMRGIENIYGGKESTRQRKFTLEELSKNDGKNGNNAYVAVDGVVYDVTYNAVWAGGTHFGLKAGNDLSKELSSCHDKQKILKELETVGVLSN